MSRFGLSTDRAAVAAAILEGVTRIIQIRGWTAIITPLEGHPILYGYTVGLTETFGFPEAVIVGVSPHTINTAFSALVTRLEVGERPLLHQPLDVNLTFPVVLRPIPSDVARQHLTFANTFYNGRGSYDAVQLVWPDADGHFPWEANYWRAENYQPLFSTGPLPE